MALTQSFRKSPLDFCGAWFALGLLLVCLAAPAAADEPSAKQPQADADAPTSTAEAAKRAPSDDRGKEAAGNEVGLVERIAKAARDSIVVITVDGRDGDRRALGAGFVISEDGLIATNLHVIGEARPIHVQFADGRKFDVIEVHASDRGLDLAIVRIDAEELPALKLAVQRNARQGEAVVVLGNPQGLRFSVVGGVVSGLRDIEGQEMLQLAVPLERGNSGGPVLDAERNVLGVVTMKSAVTANLGFAMPVANLQSLLDNPNPVPIDQWLTIGAMDPAKWKTLFGARWRQQAGKILVQQPGESFGGRALCLASRDVPPAPYELGVAVKLDDEAGAAGLAFASDGQHRHYGFYPSGGKLRLTRFAGPDLLQWTVLHNEPSPHYRAGEWNHLKVRVEEEKIRCFVNDQLVCESRDKTLTAGKVGLVKFRSTEAEFRRFELGRSLPPSQLSAKVVARLAGAVSELPALDDVLPEDIATLVEDSRGSQQVLRDQARQLERKAEQLEQLAVTVHVQAVCRRLAQELEQPPAKIDLGRAALLVSLLDNHDINVPGVLEDLDRFAETIRADLPPDASEAARIAALDKYLFQDRGFHGSRTEYYHRANSYLDRVMADREGLPITLSVLYMELGRRLELRIEGVGLPGHFVVRYVPAEGDAELIDVFHRGARLTKAEAADRVQAITGAPFRDQFLKPVPPRAIIERMLGNLQGIAEQAQDRPAALGYLEALVAISPESPAHRSRRAVLRYMNGQHRAAVADLDWFLENEPEGADLQQIAELRTFILDSRSRE